MENKMDLVTCTADKVMVGTDVQNDWIPKEQSIIFNTEFFFSMIVFLSVVLGCRCNNILMTARNHFARPV